MIRKIIGPEPPMASKINEKVSIVRPAIVLSVGGGGRVANERKDAVEKDLEHFSDVAKKELFLFHRQKLQAYEDALSLYAEAKIRTANDTIEVLGKALNKLGA
ncbi:DgyrCDS2956 [Dimorphilus gyrociliatus]|uniref:DgyrCDS2956 n=1 Tax=Dimorphilus gyrociliatus TaxID=2664684 RepID=A0A7I8VBY0_9ANNE|nr:DgyrCDS2956 [Dimorphilus gyrociliatus]